MKKTRYLTAKEAAALLGVKEATLYAYVSRGLIRSEVVGETTSREHRYNVEDVQKLAERKAQRRDPARAAQDALHWGTPMLDSALTLIADTAHYYRGQNALTLACDLSFEQVAALLWTDDSDAAPRLFAARPPVKPILDSLARLDAPVLRSVQAMQIALALASADDLGAYNLSPESVTVTGARIVWLLTAVAARADLSPNGIAGTLAAAWNVEHDDLLNAALILCADHELNVSSFAARVVASADANLYEVVIAGLAALQGVKHGGHTERVSALLREVGSPGEARMVIAERLRRGEKIPGFGHRLYPDGDPRATFLLGLLSDCLPDSPALALSDAVRRETASAIDLSPTIDFALVTLEHALRLPRGAALTLFALGRAAGWVAHAIEQYADRQIIRPRARYTGKPPQE